MAYVNWEGRRVRDIGVLGQYPECLSDLGKDFRIDGWMWCLQCEEDGGYCYSAEEVEDLRRHVLLLRRQAKDARLL